MKSIVITGATSMIGLALVKQCIRQNINVIALVRPNSSNLERLPQTGLVKVLECALDNIKSIDPGKLNIEAPDVFYHLAWDYTDKHGRYICDKQIKNIQYTLDAVELAKKLGCKRFVGAGSQAEYGNTSLPLNAAIPEKPNTAYGIAKYAAGKLSYIKCEKSGLEHIWVRILSVYGKYDNSNTLISTFIQSCQNNRELPLGPCTHIWDYLYEDDAGRAFLAIGEKGINRKIYCLGSGIGRPLKEYLEIIKNTINPAYAPQYGKFSYTENSVKFLYADISELTNDTGWKPIFSFEEGIKDIIPPPPCNLGFINYLRNQSLRKVA